MIILISADPVKPDSTGNFRTSARLDLQMFAPF